MPYAREQAAARGKRVEFNLTTNATLLTSEMIGFLADYDISVTVSIDGPREMQDRFRVFHDGRGSYDVLLPRVRADPASSQPTDRRTGHVDLTGQ